MASSPAVYAHAAWCLGYAEDGTFPLPDAAIADHDAACEAADVAPHPALVHLVTEAGRHSGRRAGLMAQRRSIEDHHREELAAVVALLLSEVDVPALAAAAAALAALQAGLSATPVQRRRAVAGAVRADLAKAMSDDTRTAWLAVNAAGFTAATAQGIAERNASDGSGPPKPSKVDKEREAAVLAVPAAATALAAESWTDQQLSALAMAAALAAGDGKDLSVATKAAGSALEDGSAALRAFGDQLHAQMMSALVTATTAMDAQAAFYFVTEDDARVCPICIALEGGPDGAGGPWPAESAPQPPQHPVCRCWLEVAGVAVAA